MVCLSDFQIFQRAQYSKCLQQPDNNNYNRNYIEKTLDFAVHRDVGVNKPENNANNNQYNKNSKQGHNNSFYVMQVKVCQQVSIIVIQS